MRAGSSRCVNQTLDQREPEVVKLDPPVVGKRPKFNRRAAASFNKIAGVNASMRIGLMESFDPGFARLGR